MGFIIFGWDFCVCDRFFNPTIQVVTFRLCGCCVLGVFLLPAFTRLGHERQDLWVRAMKCMCAQTGPRFILSSERVFWGNGVWTHVNSKGKIPSTRKLLRTCKAYLVRCSDVQDLTEAGDSYGLAQWVEGTHAHWSLFQNHRMYTNIILIFVLQMCHIWSKKIHINSSTEEIWGRRGWDWTKP